MRKALLLGLLIAGLFIGNVNAKDVTRSSTQPKKPNLEKVEKQITANIKKLIEENKVKVKVNSYSYDPQTNEYKYQFSMQTVN